MNRKTNILILYIFSSILLVSGNGISKTVKEVKRSITLETFIRAACVHDRQFQLILIDELSLKYKKALELPSKDLVLSATGQYNLKLAGDVAGGPEGIISLSKLFPFTGTETSASYSISPARSGSGYTSSFTTIVSQPLARNAFGRNTRLHDRILGLESRVSRYQIIEAYEDYLATIIGLYYQWYADTALYEASRRAWEENRRLLGNLQLRLKNRIAHPIDVNRVHLQTIISRDEMDTRRLQFEASRDLVYHAINYKGTKVLKPVFENFTASLGKNFAADYQNQWAGNRTAMILDLLVQGGKLEGIRAADDLLPSVNLLAGYSIGSTAFGLNSSYSEHQVYGGLQFAFPFGRQKEKAALEVTRIEQRKNLINKTNTKERLRNDLKTLHRRIRQEEGFITTAGSRFELARRIAVEEARLYRQARSPLKNLIEARTALEENRLNLINHRVQLSTLRLEWLRLTDQLVKGKNLDATRKNIR